MTGLSLGDLSQSYLLRSRGVSLREQLNQLSEELATGKVAETRKVLEGNVSYLADIEREMRTLESFRVAASEADQFTKAAQLALEKIQVSGGDFAASLLSLSDTPSETLVEVNANEGRNRLDAMISALNTDIAGRSMFSGTATKQPALNDADTLLTALEAVITGAATPAAARAAAQTWFDDPAGFVATMYTGSDTDLSAFRVSEGESINFGLRADDDAFREALMDIALAALADSTAMPLTVGDRVAYLKEIGFSLQAGQDTLIGLRAEVGTLESRIDTLTVRQSAQKSALELAKGDLLGVDPFETATRLEDVQFRLQSIYAVTARLSDLSLVNFL